MQYTCICIRNLCCTSCGLGYEPADHSQASRGQQGPGRTISLLPLSHHTTYTQAAGASLSALGAIISCFSAASCYAVHWRKLWWFCRFPRKFSDSAHSGNPQYLPLSPPCVVRHLVELPSRQALQAPNHRALCSHVSLLNFPLWAGVPHAQAHHAKPGTGPFSCFLSLLDFFSRLSSSDSLPTTPDPGFIADGLITSPGPSRGPSQPLEAPESPTRGLRYFSPKAKTEVT